MATQAQPARPVVPPARSQLSAPRQPLRPVLNFTRPGRAPVNTLELRVAIHKVPKSWNTWDIYTFFQTRGNVVRVDIRERRTLDLHAVVLFQPVPKDISWVGRNLNVSDPDGAQRAIETKNVTGQMRTYPSPHDSRMILPERMVVSLAGLHFGMMKNELEFLSLRSLHSAPKTNIEIAMDLHFKEFILRFPVNGRAFKFQFTPAQVSQAFHLAEEDGSHSIVLILDSPPLAFRKSNNLRDTHNSAATLWNEQQAWFRQTDIDHDPTFRSLPVALRKTSCIVDIGRWTTYRFKFSPASVASPDYRYFCQALADHNIVLTQNKDISFTHAAPDVVWSWDEDPLPKSHNLEGAFVSALQELDEASYYLPFPLRYQLEVCLSQGVLNEANIDRVFLQRLAAIETARAIKVLEKLADNKVREYNPSNALGLQNQVSVVEKKKRPVYCTKNSSVVITPTTIYMATPVLETSNRVIRQFSQHEDRFLRVKFTDERHKGKIWSCDDNSKNEIFSRIKRAMTHGIQIGDRHYEFLAFGNSQFREHGAYFFASTNTLTANMIRDWMGRFSHIRVIAKYVSRLGQCFSTTRAIPNAVTLDRIDDIERNGYCFTDGAGKMSPFLARMIALHHNMPNSEQNFPSAVQFRLAGCKGVLAVDPSLKGLAIQIRPSQEKFPAEFHGLEVCRISQFSTANLNMQIILVLSALGIGDEVFLGKMRAMLLDVQQAMSDEHKALELLQKNIDYSQTTILLASLIIDGFMEAQEPFLITTLRLWRSWCLKYLKEKARIYIEKGYFGLAVPDETGTLKGQCNNRPELNGDTPDADDINAGEFGDETNLPEIFLQVPDPDAPGKYRVIEAICILARNPSLHPGDVRIVQAVDNKDLYHLRDVVVIPTTGDRDLANMCSGGDLDGDDFMVIWDPDMIPAQPSHPPMDYTSPDPVTSDGPVSVDDMTTFFVKHIKNDNLSSIAVAHRYWADFLPDGVKDPMCIELAQLHSKAVDYPKTGVPAIMSPHLKVQKWPHWSEPKNKAKGKIYTSHRVLGKLYDEVKKEPFDAAWNLPFDQRILTACEPTEEMLQDAREVKALYDEAVRRIMAQHGIKTEFEVFTGFVLDHHQEIGDYKFAETMSTIIGTLLEEHRDLCYEKVRINRKGHVTSAFGPDHFAQAKARIEDKAREDKQMELFIVAMYKVTADEVTAAYQDTKQMKQKGGRDVPVRPLSFEAMPFMSFPWIFARELGQIATKGKSKTSRFAMPRPTMPTKGKQAKQQRIDLLGEDFQIAPLAETKLSTQAGVFQEGDILGLFTDNASSVRRDMGEVDDLAINANSSVHPRTSSLDRVDSLEAHKESKEPPLRENLDQDQSLPLSELCSTRASNVLDITNKRAAQDLEPLLQFQNYNLRPLTTGDPAESQPQSKVGEVLEPSEFQVPVAEPVNEEVRFEVTGDTEEVVFDGGSGEAEFETVSSTLDDKFTRLFG